MLNTIAARVAAAAIAVVLLASCGSPESSPANPGSPGSSPSPSPTNTYVPDRVPVDGPVTSHPAFPNGTMLTQFRAHMRSYQAAGGFTLKGGSQIEVFTTGGYADFRMEGDVEPGGSFDTEVTIEIPVTLTEGQKFLVMEGGKAVGEGVVAKITGKPIDLGEEFPALHTTFTTTVRMWTTAEGGRPNGISDGYRPDFSFSLGGATVEFPNDGPDLVVEESDDWDDVIASNQKITLQAPAFIYGSFESWDNEDDPIRHLLSIWPVDTGPGARAFASGKVDAEGTFGDRWTP